MHPETGSRMAANWAYIGKKKMTPKLADMV